MIDNKEKNKELFAIWLAENVPSARLSEQYLCLSEIETYCLKTKVLCKSLFDTTDLNTIKRAQKTVVESRIFKFSHKKQMKKIVVAMQYYTAFLKSTIANRVDATGNGIIENTPTASTGKSNNETTQWSKDTLSEKKKEDDTLQIDFLNLNGFAFTKPVFFLYFGEKQTDISNWTQLYVKVIACLQEDYPDEFLRMYNTNISGGRRIDFGTQSESEKMKAPKKVNDNLYVETNMNATEIVTKIRVLLDRCRVDYENLEIHYVKFDTTRQTELALKENIQLQVSSELKLIMPTVAVVDPAIRYLQSNDMSFIDCRSKGGCLWIIGNSELERYLRPLIYAGVSLHYKDEGGNATGKKSAWWTKDDTSHIELNGSLALPVTIKEQQENMGVLTENSSRMHEQPEETSTATPDNSLTQEAEDYLLQRDLTGATYDELQSTLHYTMVGTKEIVAHSPHIIEMERRLYHEEAFVDFEEGADTLETILDKLLKKNDGIATAKHLYEYARSEMTMFLNDNGITSQQSVYDLARHLFEKLNYHGKKYIFKSNMYISLPNVSADSVIDIVKKYARDKGSTVTFKEAESYLIGLGLNTGNLRGMLRIDKEPVFLVYDENVYLLAELMHIDVAFLKEIHFALHRLFSDSDGHIIPRRISENWYNMLPTLPACLQWTPMLLQQLIRFYPDELEARTIIAMESQSSNTLHAMFVENKSWIHDFRDVVAVFLHEEMPNRCEFEAEELRKILIDAGMINGSQLIWHMHIALGGDSRFLWNSDGSHVKVRI